MMELSGTILVVDMGQLFLFFRHLIRCVWQGMTGLTKVGMPFSVLGVLASISLSGFCISDFIQRNGLLGQLKVNQADVGLVLQSQIVLID